MTMMMLYIFFSNNATRKNVLSQAVLTCLFVRISIIVIIIIFIIFVIVIIIIFTIIVIVIIIFIFIFRIISVIIINQQLVLSAGNNDQVLECVNQG